MTIIKIKVAVLIRSIVVGNVIRLLCVCVRACVCVGGGDVYSWGWNEHGMCGQGHEDNVLQLTHVTCLSNIEAIACGAGHSLALAR
jgi:alpha-tubulin suppressor-like RCC1 family protein